MKGALLALLALVLPTAAGAQALQCRAPALLPPPHSEGPSASEPQRLLPIGGYTLAIAWSPQACRDAAEPFRCGGGNRFGFTLHGLWPDGEGAQWPQYCRPAALLPQALLRRHICTTPSAQLLQHEYAKHGTCMGLTPAAYFRQSTGLYRRLYYPDMAALARRGDLTAGRFAAAFAAANSGMRADMMRLNVSRDGWLAEVWLCLDTRLRRRTCPATQGGAAADATIRIVPQS